MAGNDDLGGERWSKIRERKSKIRDEMGRLGEIREKENKKVSDVKSKNDL